ncbi:MAG: biopolymer transporter ExbD [Gammaproteobacteria bacterium]|nr:biopolymer transporter ExbD [Gammaproteobacteria bacterium]
MKMSRRAKRMEKSHKRNKGASLNMVSLMDIFTILVFFLLVNSSDVQLSQSENVQLPESKANQLPNETLVIMVSGDQVLVQGRLVATVDEIMAMKGNIIPALKEELQQLSGNSFRQLSESELREIGRPITIMGHKEIPYQLLKKIMFTSSKSNYSNISLAVLKKTEGEG